MGRANRLHHPGSAFHIVARTQGQEYWFVDELKDRIADTLLTGVASAGARPVAFSVMDNHFHLILFQGRSPLGETMQPPLRRIALLIQKMQARTGHVFERRYRAKLCQDAEHLPNAILYVHRNPVAARICTTATDYRWSSANAYEGNCPPGFISVVDGLRAFDSTGSGKLEAMRESYRDRLNRQSDDELDEYWSWFCRRIRRRRNASDSYVPLTLHTHRAGLRDLRDVAVQVLCSIDDAAVLEIVRSRYGGPRIVQVRTQLIAALLQRGYAGVDIARYLRISQATVSRIRSAMRWVSIRGISQQAALEHGKQVR
jgi:REP element-mobilizing transposase RayT